MDWKQIDTAPKDGQNIFVWWIDRYGDGECSERVYWDLRGEGGTWVCRTDGEDLFNKSGDYATHWNWMPLSGPPSEDTQ